MLSANKQKQLMTQRKNGVPKNVQVNGIRGINNVPDYVKMVDNLIKKPEQFRRFVEISSSKKALEYAKERIPVEVKNQDDRTFLLAVIKAKI